jgi:hypothetical protein
MRFELQPCDEQFFVTAPTRHVATMDVPLPAEQVWRDLTADDTLRWCRAISGVDWTSPRPFGVGTTRTVRLLGVLAVDEKYFHWDEGRRKSFHLVRANLPLFRRVAEDYIVEEKGPSACRFTWTIAAEPLPATRPGAPLNALIFRSLFRDTRRHLGAQKG